MNTGQQSFVTHAWLTTLCPEVPQALALVACRCQVGRKQSRALLGKLAAPAGGCIPHALAHKPKAVCLLRRRQGDRQAEVGTGQARLGQLAAAAAEAEAEAAEIGDRLAALATEKELQAGGEVRELAAQADALAKQCALRAQTLSPWARELTVAVMRLAAPAACALHTTQTSNVRSC